MSNVVFEDTTYIIMTPDKKCVVRGRKSPHTTYELTTLEEKSKKKILTCRNTSDILHSLTHSSTMRSGIALSNEAKKLYNVDRYTQAQFGDLIAVKVKRLLEVDNI